MIVHVEQTKIQVARENENVGNHAATETDQTNLRIDLQTTIGIYVSRRCSDVIQQYRDQTNDSKLSLSKISNITSSRRMISAIHSLNEWNPYRSILKPMSNDIYFQLPEDFDLSNVRPTDGFNLTQSKAIAIAECMFDDLFDRMHLVHGPPGISFPSSLSNWKRFISALGTGKSRTIAGIVLKLLSKLSESGRKRKILLCAPSNNACDELARRILDEVEKREDIPFKQGKYHRSEGVCHTIIFLLK